MFNSLRVFLELEGPRLNILQFTGNHEDKVDAKEMEAMFMMYMDVSTEVLGALVNVVDGTANAGTFWTCTNTTVPTLGTDALTFVQLSGGGGSISVTDGSTTVNPATEIDFTSGAVVSDLGGGVAGVAIAASSGAHFLVISSGHSAPLVFGDIVQDSGGDDFIYTT